MIRAAILASAATVGVACGGELTQGADAGGDAASADAGRDTGAVIPPSDASAPPDATIAPPYGVPPRDQ